MVKREFLPLALLAVFGCARLHFLKSPSVPRERGESETQPGPGFAPEPLRSGTDVNTDWIGYNNGYNGNRFSQLARITSENVSQLRQHCVADLEVRAAMESG